MGKTALLKMLTSEGKEFQRDYVLTRGVDISSRLITPKDSDTDVEMFFFDCSGQSFFKSIVKECVRKEMSGVTCSYV